MILNTALSAGARIADREAVIRSVSAKQSREGRIEIRPDAAASPPTGVTFKVTHLPSSAVRAAFTTSGHRSRGEAKWGAVNGAGFEKRGVASRQTPQLIGAQVAYDSMTKFR